MTPELSVQAARIVTAVILVAIGVTHFVPSIAGVMAAIIPPGMRNRPFSAAALVRLTGVCEIAGGLGLLWEPTRLAAGILLAIFLVCVFPANAYAARHPERFGRVAVAFWPRLALQVALIGVVLWVAIA
jgi:uncharacterized membrane protein